ncbi:MAG: methyltransferase domain-containing protein [Thermodesulfobacteriota bacterium]
MTKDFDSEYWSSVVTRLAGSGYEELWRFYSQWVYRVLMERWFFEDKNALALKTDLYDEAITASNLLAVMEERCGRVVGTDISLEVARFAATRMYEETGKKSAAVISDARSLGFRSDSFDRIVSTSTLDHFRNKRDLYLSIKELVRILKPGGELLITLDNPLNPVVFLRNHLPYGLLKRLGIINFYVGATLSRPALVRALEEMGLHVEEQSVIIHAPRIIALKISSVLKLFESNGLRRSYLAALRFFECLGALPTRDLTGYFVAVKAVKKQDGG